MKNTPSDEGARWLRQAGDDLKYARVLLKEGGYALACFVSQQVAEKALKGFLFERGVEEIRSHSVKDLGEWCARYDKTFSALVEKAKKLDGYYIPTRYPNGWASGSPFEYYTRVDAKEAVKLAAMTLAACRKKS